MKSFLILGCSATKRPGTTPMPAFECYDGPLHRVLRGWMCRTPDWRERLDVTILSARYGLLAAETLIEPYNQHITLGRALRLRRDIAVDLRACWRGPYTGVYISLGAPYRKALPQVLPWPVTFAQGGIGTRQRELKHWLKGLV
jgi:hypothetical protein